MVMDMTMRHGGNVWEDAHPERWLDFSANLRAGGVPAWVQETLLHALDDVRYYPDRAMRAARDGLAAYAGVKATQILPTAGGIAAIDLALSRDRGRVLVAPPTFGGYEERARAHARSVKAWQGTCCPGDTVVICNPNNPTGQAYSRQEILALHQRVTAQGGTLLVDEAFIDYCPECSVRGDVRASLLVTGSLTKTLGIPGVRLGYLCADAQTIAMLEGRALSWSVSALASAVAAELPRHMDEIRADAAANAQRRERMTQALTGLGATILPSRANFVLTDFGRDMTACVVRLHGRGILVRTCASFGLSEQYLRLAVKTEEENACLIKALEEVLACVANR